MKTMLMALAGLLILGGVARADDKSGKTGSKPSKAAPKKPAGVSDEDWEFMKKRNPEHPERVVIHNDPDPDADFKRKRNPKNPDSVVVHEMPDAKKK